jgi:CubicO group peptidase (beta-lactamase class C family)
MNQTPLAAPRRIGENGPVPNSMTPPEKTTANRRSLLAAAALALGPTLASALAPSCARAQTSARFSAAAAYSEARNGAALVVARNGIVLAEHYANGVQAHVRWPIGAGTRMFTPVLIASLIDDRLMGLDEPAALTLGDWGVDPFKSVITIRALLSGASGLSFGRSGPGTLDQALALTPVAAAGERFIEDSAAYMVLVEIARRKLEAAGRAPDPASYLTDRTLAPIGCVPIGWTRDATGAPRFDFGAHVSARGWAQLGELVRREGVWRARQLADRDTLREARRGGHLEARAGMGLWLSNGARSPKACRCKAISGA